MRCVLALFLIGCGGIGGAGGGDGGGDGGGGGGDATGGADAQQPTRTGWVSIQSYDAMNMPNTPTRGGTASAEFDAMGAFCTTTQTIGPCERMSCGSTPPPAVSAGAITITGAQQPITLTPAANKTYPGFMVMSTLYAGGETITFSAAGADVPAFTKSLVVASKATITAPPEPPESNPLLVVNRTHDFSVSWTGGGSGLMEVFLFTGSADQRMICRFAASAGSGKIPNAALMTLPAGQGGYGMGAISRTEQAAGDWGVEVSSYFNAVWPTNHIVGGPTMFQ